MGNAERWEFQLEASCCGHSASPYQDINKHRRQVLYSCWKCLELLLQTAVEGRARLPGSEERGVHGKERFGCCEYSHQTPLRNGKMQQFSKYRPFLRGDLRDHLLRRTDWIREAVTEFLASPEGEQIPTPTVPHYLVQVSELLPAGS